MLGNPEATGREPRLSKVIYGYDIATEPDCTMLVLMYAGAVQEITRVFGVPIDRMYPKP